MARAAGQQFCPEFYCGQMSVDLPYSSILQLSAGNNKWTKRKLYCGRQAWSLAVFGDVLKINGAVQSYPQVVTAWAEGRGRAGLLSGFFPLCLHNLKGFCPPANFKVFWNTLSRITCTLEMYVCTDFIDNVHQENYYFPVCLPSIKHWHISNAALLIKSLSCISE